MLSPDELERLSREAADAKNACDVALAKWRAEKGPWPRLEMSASAKAREAKQLYLESHADELAALLRQSERLGEEVERQLATWMLAHFDQSAESIACIPAQARRIVENASPSILPAVEGDER